MSGDGTVVFVHAHPDDEAIFTGGTMVRLAARGVRVVLIVATGGELGEVPHGYRGDDADAVVGPPGSAEPAAPGRSLAEIRREESRRAAELLGIHHVEFLGYSDSGMEGDPRNHEPESFWSQPVGEVADRLSALLRRHGASSVVGYDERGVYGHPDHVQVTRAVTAAAEQAGVATVYGATVDREHLHFVETHVVEEAVLEGDLGLVRSRIGVASVEVATTVDVRGVLAEKRAAMAAHASQIPESASALQLPSHHFTDVYGWEWYVRHGPPAALDMLA